MLTQALRSVMFSSSYKLGAKGSIITTVSRDSKTIPKVEAWVAHFILLSIWKHMFLAITNPKSSSLLSQSKKYMTRIEEHGPHYGVSLENMENMKNKMSSKAFMLFCRKSKYLEHSWLGTV